jgi:hypothetical protein
MTVERDPQSQSEIGASADRRCGRPLGLDTYPITARSNSEISPHCVNTPHDTHEVGVAMITPEQFGVLSGMLQIASFWTMIRPVAWPKKDHKRQAPHRVSWLGWVCLYQVMFWSSLARGARGSLWVVGAEVLGTLTMFGLSLKWGTGSLRLVGLSPSRRWITVANWSDFLVLCGTAAGLAGWQLTSSPSLGIVFTVAVDTLAALPLIRVLPRAPWTVSLLGWSVSGLASLAAIFSVARGQPIVLYLYPVTGLALDAVVVGAILAGYRRVGRKTRLLEEVQAS